MPPFAFNCVQQAKMPAPGNRSEADKFLDEVSLCSRQQNHDRCARQKSDRGNDRGSDRWWDR
jgi:hypothetical protein